MVQFNSETNNQDLVSEIRQICGVDSNGYSIEAITRRVNDALHRYFTIAFQADGRWNFDDINETSPPIETQNLVSGTNRYKLSDFTSDIIDVLRVEVLTSAGEGRYITPETFGQLNKVVNSENTSGRVSGYVADTFQDLYIDAQSGTPTHYIKYGNFIYLRPNPNYNETDGLKIYFHRPASTIAHDDTTKEPGIPEIHHFYLCRYAAYPKLVELKKFNEADRVRQEIQKDERAIQDYFANRNRDIKRGITPRVENNR